MAELTVEERVADGAKWLDEKQPGWVDRINLPTLKMSSSCGCIIGQLIGDYADVFFGPNPALRFSESDAIRLGFDATYSDLPGFRSTGGTAKRDYTALEAEWKRVITARREADR